MRDHTIETYLTELAARTPAPGGGAAAALHAAQAAALVGMVARYTTGPKYTDRSETVGLITERADALRGHALQLAAEDAAAFTAVTEAYKLPKDTDEAKAARSAAIAAALLDAARPAEATITCAADVVALAEKLLPIGNRNVITDVGAAAEAARAAAATARLNIEINLSGIKDPDARTALLRSATLVDALAERTEHITATVRKEITR
ncbi:cyclodeaminase/cyclohydrolase family protein [Streptomyces sp. UNOC14_S4]|uniref:cyclodeaminase/cyclohydrolase family protein n=1 Tax=Streptomyces sp. UNOC14_S4 TaxID=2872340 RepID=UPI001E49A15F|nr:cyclodeaminase/cyclohydrolase family protein [Streptomyces sp. UNOC14_S4]MCC3770901.1 cyclodeaminase/cyclohydrolase family protein [Streptomyces sp. UNOC14_S4]